MYMQHMSLLRNIKNHQTFPINLSNLNEHTVQLQHDIPWQIFALNCNIVSEIFYSGD